MVQRSKRSLHVSEAQAMQRVLREFHHQVRTWAGKVPIGTNVYLCCDFLNTALILTDMQLTATIHKLEYERPAGFQGLE